MQETNGKLCGNLLRWHIRPLLDVRHVDCPIAVPIGVLMLVRSTLGVVAAAEVDASAVR
jgi:hypothetical protein